MSWNNLPQELKELVFDFSGLLEENKKKFDEQVLPLIIRESYLHQIRRRQREHQALCEYEFRQCYLPSNFNVFLRGERIMNVLIYAISIRKNWGGILGWYDESWDNLDDLLQCLVRHLEGEPLPDSSVRYEWD